jgi:hypothetical protein
VVIAVLSSHPTALSPDRTRSLAHSQPSPASSVARLLSALPVDLTIPRPGAGSPSCSPTDLRRPAPHRSTAEAAIGVVYELVCLITLSNCTQFTIR